MKRIQLMLHATSPVLVIGAVLLMVLTVVSGKSEANATAGTECSLGSPMQVEVTPAQKSQIAQGKKIEIDQADSSGCKLSFTITHGRNAPDSLSLEDSCVVRVSPIGDPSAPSVRVHPSGSCLGLGFLTTIQMTPEDPTESQFGLSQRWVDARTVAEDVVSWPMIIVSSQINWQYDGTNVYHINSPTYWDNPPFSPPFPQSYWFLNFATDQTFIHPPGGLLGVGAIEHYYYTSNGTNGFPSSSQPDATAWIQPTAWGLGNGGFICEHYHEWGGYYYPGTHWRDVCSYYP